MGGGAEVKTKGGVTLFNRMLWTLLRMPDWVPIFTTRELRDHWAP